MSVKALQELFSGKFMFKSKSKLAL